MRRDLAWFLNEYGTLDDDSLEKLMTKPDVRPPRQTVLKRRYSVTADILSYRRCPRQYGFFARRGFAPAESGQLWFGTVIHRTLDRAYRHWRGDLDPSFRGNIPDDGQIGSYFNIATAVLESQQIRPLGREAREKALEYITRFNRIEGPGVYPRIRDTEHLLQKDTGRYIMHGVVDVLASTEQGAGLERPGELEIWDYKGARLPKLPEDNEELENYRFQMRVYAHLYELRWGQRPSKAVLWFLAENPPSGGRLEVNIAPEAISEAVGTFEGTVSKIEASIESDSWPAPQQEMRPSAETCDACDIRWNCTAHANHPYPLRTIGTRKRRPI